MKRCKYILRGLLLKFKSISSMHLLFVLITACLFFFIGCYVGYSGIGLNGDTKYQLITIPFLTMLGTWVSGVGAFSAVATSLLLAHRSLKENSEEIAIRYSMVLIPSMYLPSTTDTAISITITNKRKVRSNIQSVVLQFSNNKAMNIWVNPGTLISGKLPHVLEDYGDILMLIIPESITASVTDEGFVKECQGNTLGEGSVVVHTTTKTFVKKLTLPQVKPFNDKFKSVLTKP
ncbi:hypothetical protein WKP56_004907 [Escherichia coli]|uniref:hypothetical protein n=1 Tax=Escherichia coli TaxID=562 RepID=UPI00050A8E4A|nr:hypothetical protein [Escherichia coli]EGO7664457.1 hypothetical protein [Escherichia coli]EGO7979086.1 hypothetical protein [Escherichia coli]EGO8040790.1 hypothetical protein [Escherichia coli]EHD6248486.1 hypothetical protein [Escherichia coli]EHR8382368.1 hypothetical protein [Escherichia coli]